MVQPLTGLTGLAGYQQQIDADAQATPEERLGGPADPRHGNWGEQAAPYPWQSSLAMGGSHGPYGPENQMLGDEEWFLTPAGDWSDDPTLDRTPETRAAPKPKGILSGPVPGATPDDIADQLQQSMFIHSIDTGASLRRIHPPSTDIQNDSWAAALDDVSPGSTDVQPIGKQNMSSGFMFGTRDRVQSFARQNEYGFDSAHKFRRVATGSIPGNTYWMRPGGRPLAKSLPGPARPAIGPTSPFAGQDLGQTFSIDGAILQRQPTEYVPPSQPYLAPAGQTNNGDDVQVEWY